MTFFRSDSFNIDIEGHRNVRMSVRFTLFCLLLITRSWLLHIDAIYLFKQDLIVIEPLVEVRDRYLYLFVFLPRTIDRAEAGDIRAFLLSHPREA